MSKTTALRSFMSRNAAAIMTVIAVGSIGSVLLNASFAATTNHNPTGEADSCAIADGKTTIYGWGYDPDAGKSVQPYVDVTVGSKTLKEPTNVSGYRDAAINAGLKKSYPGSPEPGEYGWVAQFSDLYQGTTYKISGKVLNYGSGTADSVALSINTTHHVDGDSSKPYFGSGDIPKACLQTKVTPPSPPAPPTPTPTPPTNPAPPKNGGGSSSTKNPSTGSDTQSSAPAKPATSADATVSPGTMGASLTIPADGATSVHIIFAVSNGALTNDTAGQAVSGDSTTIELPGLTAKTAYSYQIVRTNSGGTVNSPSATFTTKGYDISLVFLGKSSKPVSGIKGNLSSGGNATSNNQGIMTFSNLDAGDYTVTFNYGGTDHAVDYDTDSVVLNTGDDPTQILVVSDTIDLTSLKTSTSSHQTDASHASPAGWIIFVLCLLAAAAGGWFFWRRRRLPGDSPPVYAPAPGLPDIIDQKVNQHFSDNPPPPPAAHMNESLRDMVIKSMHEAASQKRDRPKPPHVPGG